MASTESRFCWVSSAAGDEEATEGADRGKINEAIASGDGLRSLGAGEYMENKSKKYKNIRIS